MTLVHEPPASVVGYGAERVAPPLRVFLIDDHRVFTDLLALALDGDPGLSCVAVAAGVDEGLRKADAHVVDVFVLDVHLGDDDGLGMIEVLAQRHPAARIVVLTAHPTAHGSARALSAGASAYLAKDGRLRDLLRAIRTATRSRPVLSPNIGCMDAVALTPREHEVLALLGSGRRLAEIAVELDLSPHTVRDHVKSLREKFDVRSQLAVVAAATAAGLLPAARR